MPTDTRVEAEERAPKNCDLRKGPAWWNAPRSPNQAIEVDIVRVMPKMATVRAVRDIGPSVRPKWGIKKGETFIVARSQLRARRGQGWIKDC